jgi:acetyl-CoA C-acetyltransferase
MTAACIVGWAHSPFGKLEDPDVESLIGRVAGSAIADAGIAPTEIDAVFVGLFNNGFSKQDFPSSLAFQSVPELRFKPSTRTENACASGSAAIYAARDFLAAGRGRFALVIGAEKMTATPGAQVGDILLSAAYRREEGEIPAGFAGVFGQIAQNYFQRYGDQSDALAAIAAKNHRNGVDNPYAQMRRDLGFDFCRTISDKNPIVAGPLKRTDCSLVSDGAAALILTDEDTAASAPLCRSTTSCRSPAATPPASRGPPKLFPARSIRPGSPSMISPSPRCMIVLRLPNCSNTKPWDSLPRARAPARCSKAGRQRTAACRSTAPAA